MSGISSLEIEPDDSFWEIESKEIGKQLVWASGVIALGATVPVFFKKKRIYTLIVPESSEIAAPATAAQEEAIPRILQCNEEVKGKIVRLWTEIANGSMDPRLIQLGNEIENTHKVHPFALFIALPKDKIQQILNNQKYSFTWIIIPRVISGIGGGMLKALSEERPSTWPELWTLIPSFAKQMNKEEAQIKRWIQGTDWKGLVHYLFDIKT